MSEHENPPAFPPAITVSASGDVYHGYDGMTLRDWFAGQALAGLMANPSTGDDRAPDYAYFLAEQMLAERAKERQP